MTGLLLFAASVGIFEGSADVGTVLRAGSVEYDSAARTYSVAGTGENMWFASDAFHFAWKKVSGDVTLTANVKILGQGGDPHRKAVLMIRQSLDADSAYADAAVHGDGLTSLQTRDAKGEATHEIQASVTGPARVRISKRGSWFYLSVAAEGGEMRPAGGWMKAAIDGTFYVGIGVCAHNKDAVERALFSNVELVAAASHEVPQPWSTLETVTVASTDRRAILATQGRMEAPAWSPDGAALVFAQSGHLRRVAVTGGQAEPLETGPGLVCTRPCGFSPDGKTLAFAARAGERAVEQIYVMPASGGKPRRNTTLICAGEPKGIFTVPAEGAKETALIAGAENAAYTPDGQYVYFNSNRAGSMQVWRARAGGTGAEQVTTDAMTNSFPHVSPDGKWLAFLSAVPGSGGETLLRVMSLDGGEIRVMGRLFGGGAPSWSPDSKRLAFVSDQEF
jgi:Tol biopolymer transport system component